MAFYLYRLYDNVDPFSADLRAVYPKLFLHYILASHVGSYSLSTIQTAATLKRIMEVAGVIWYEFYRMCWTHIDSNELFYSLYLWRTRKSATIWASIWHRWAASSSAVHELKNTFLKMRRKTSRLLSHQTHTLLWEFRFFWIQLKT